jgi:hypothetical protein
MSAATSANVVSEEQVDPYAYRHSGLGYRSRDFAEAPLPNLGRPTHRSALTRMSFPLWATDLAAA